RRKLASISTASAGPRPPPVRNLSHEHPHPGRAVGGAALRPGRYLPRAESVSALVDSIANRRSAQMANELIQPDKFFLSRFGMTESALERTLGAALERKADYADLYFESRSAEGLSL